MYEKDRMHIPCSRPFISVSSNSMKRTLFTTGLLFALFLVAPTSTSAGLSCDVEKGLDRVICRLGQKILDAGAPSVPQCVQGEEDMEVIKYSSSLETNYCRLVFKRDQKDVKPEVRRERSRLRLPGIVRRGRGVLNPYKRGVIGVKEADPEDSDPQDLFNQKTTSTELRRKQFIEAKLMRRYRPGGRYTGATHSAQELAPKSTATRSTTKTSRVYGRRRVREGATSVFQPLASKKQQRKTAAQKCRNKMERGDLSLQECINTFMRGEDPFAPKEEMEEEMPARSGTDGEDEMSEESEGDGSDEGLEAEE